MKKYKVYTVWFEQVNMSMYTVRALSPENAVKAASKSWKQENKEPHMSYVEDADGNGVMRS